MVGVSQLVANGGALPHALVKPQPIKMSERKRGLKQGAVLMLSGFIIVPILGIISAALNAEPVLMAIVAILTFLGGLLRMIYAMLFESKAVEAQNESIFPEFVGKRISPNKQVNSLPPAENIPNPNYIPPVVNWRDTNDLAAPSSVTEETTKLFQKRN